MSNPRNPRNAAWRPVPAPLPGMKCWQKDLPDGHLTALLSNDPDGLHLSISHRRDSRSGPVPGRNPRWEEIKEARYRFCPNEVTMAMLLPPMEEYVNVHETTFHLWQVPGEVSVDGRANTCTHQSASGIDQAPDGPEKIWRCDHCGLRWKRGDR